MNLRMLFISMRKKFLSPDKLSYHKEGAQDSSMLWWADEIKPVPKT